MPLCKLCQDAGHQADTRLRQATGFRSFKEGQSVTYVAEWGPKGQQAMQVRLA